MIDWIGIQRIPRLLEIVHPQHQREILTAPEDRVVRDPDLLQFGEQLRPHPLMLPLVFFNRIGLDAQLECVTRHADMVSRCPLDHPEKVTILPSLSYVPFGSLISPLPSGFAFP